MMDKETIKIYLLAICFVASMILLGNLLAYLFILENTTTVSFERMKNFLTFCLLIGSSTGCFVMSRVVPFLLKNSDGDGSNDKN